MNQAKITELDLEQEGVKIHLRKGPTREELTSAIAQPVPQAIAPVIPAEPLPAAAPPVVSSKLHTITSPMVGTFYRAPSPEANSYTETGDQVEEDTIVCIVEAMKLMNEIKAEVKGVIKEILIENAQAVEYGQPLFLVERRG
ncbi:acetyl-CoA carboxylase biotin carboxyl carrier protein [bacterium]|nr:acetyl-CoA carboxylase biotin carboxyl carrier protein [bacterium]